MFLPGRTRLLEDHLLMVWQHLIIQLNRAAQYICSEMVCSDYVHRKARHTVGNMLAKLGTLELLISASVHTRDMQAPKHTPTIQVCSS